MENGLEKIKNALDSMQDTWHLDNQSRDISTLNNFVQLIDKKMEKYKDLSTEKIDKKNMIVKYEIPYNASPFHFFLYYAYPPNIPFVVFGKECIIFGSFIGRRHNELFLSIPIYKDYNSAILELNNFLSNSIEILIKNLNIKTVILRDIDEKFAELLKKRENNDNSDKFILKSLKEMKYSIYDIERTLKLHGKTFHNLRWHYNYFKRGNHKIESIPLKEAEKNVIHLIGEWRRIALKQRKFSYANVGSDIFGAKLFGDSKFNREKSYHMSEISKDKISSNDVLTRVLKIDGKIYSFNLGYPLGLNKKSKVFAHAIGIADITVQGLAEYAAIDFWKYVKKQGYKYINDGPTWRKGLADFKDKFVPIDKKRYYWATLSLI